MDESIMENPRWKCAVGMAGAIGMLAMTEGEVQEDYLKESKELRALEQARKHLEVELHTYLHNIGIAFLGRDLRYELARMCDRVRFMDYAAEDAVLPVAEYLEGIFNGQRKM